MIELYSKTFNAPVSTRMVYDKVIDKYDEFFDKEKKDAAKSLDALVAGK